MGTEPSQKGTTQESDTLAEQYAEALRQYLANAEEEARARAYELGRSALTSGLGVLDVALLYRDALNASEPSYAEQRFLRAIEFLAETLAPFEMTLRGYDEANKSLQVLNRTLTEQNVQLQRAQAASTAANEELEAFSYSVAHDLRAPLRHIDGFSRLLLTQSAASLDPQGKEYLARVVAAAQRMGQLIDDLLALSRATQVELHIRSVDVTAMARAVLTDLAATQRDRSVSVLVHEGLRVDADPRLLRIVLENLLGNAWKFTGHTADAAIEVGSEKVHGQTLYFVRDNGAGFDSAYAARLFTPFKRLHHESEFPGTGIGLATVRRVLQRHAGRIWAEAAVGRGATFYWTLPNTLSAPP